MTHLGAPPPSSGSDPAHDAHAGGPPEILERVMQDLQDVHLAPSSVERALSWWKRFGGRRAAMLVLAVTMPLIRYEYIPHALSTAVETLAEGYGLQLKVGDWETSFSDIKVVAKDVEITTAGPYREKRLFRAHSVEFDWSLVRGLSNGVARLSGCWTSIVGRECMLPEEVFHRIVIDGATLHMERSMAGAWNTEEAFRVRSLDELRRTVRRWQIPTVEGNDLNVSWVEQLPGDSGGGLVEQRTSAMDFTKVTITVADLQVPDDDRENPTRFTFDGQTADGQVSVAGALNASRWDHGTWAPSYDVTYKLANVGAASFGRFAAPDATLVPKGGRVDGDIVMARAGAVLTRCVINLRLRDVTYGVNPRSPYSRAAGLDLEREVETLRINDVVSKDCGILDGPPAGPRDAPGEPRHDRRTVEALHTLLTAGAVEKGPPVVRAAAGFDQSAVVEGRTPTAAEIGTRVSEQLGKAIGGEKGAAVAQALTASTAPGSNGNAVTRGAKSLGRGIKRLFGGDKPASKERKPGGR